MQPSDHRGSEHRTNAPVDALLARILDAHPDQRDSALEALCREHPAHAKTLRRRWQILARLTRGSDPSPEGAGVPFDRLGPYELIRRIGGGGMGTVYLAHQRDMGRLVALKLVRRDLLGSARTRARFQREVLAASRLDHANICTVYQAGEIDDVPYCAMRLVEGSSLAELLDDARRRHDGSRMLTLPDVESTSADATPTPHGAAARGLFRILHLIEKVARALHHAHEAGLVHRDIKPGNVMVAHDGEPVVLDFGLAQVEDEDDVRLTLTGEQLGTPAYMSPEQVESGGPRPDRRTDVYSLGATLFECLTLRCPFEGLTRESLYREILRAPVPNPTRLNPAIPRDVRVVLETALEKDPDRRYPDCLAFADDLRRIQERRTIAARSLGVHLRTLRWVQRNAIASAFGAVLVAGLGATLWRNAVAAENARIAQANERTAKEQAAAATRARDVAERRRADIEEIMTTIVMTFDDRIRDLPGSRPARQFFVEQALKFLAAVSEDAPGDWESRAVMAMARMKVAETVGSPELPSLGDTEQALIEAQAALGLQLELLDEPAPDEFDAATLLRNISITHELIGNLRHAMGDDEGALASHRAALQFTERYARSAGRTADASVDLAVGYDQVGRGLEVLGRLEEAEAALGEGRRHWEEAIGAHPDEPYGKQGLATCLEKIGLLALKRGQPEAARDAFGESVALYRSVRVVRPNDSKIVAGLASSLVNLAKAEAELGGADRASEALAEAVRLARQSHDVDPGDVTAAMRLSRVLAAAGSHDLGAGRLDDAAEKIGSAIEIAEERLGTGALDLGERRSLTYLRERYAAVLAQQGALDEALAIDLRNLADRERILSQEPSLLSRRELAVALQNVAIDYALLERLEDSLATHNRHLDVVQQLSRDDPEDVRARLDCALARSRIADVLERMGRPEDALAAYREAARLLDDFLAANGRQPDLVSRREHIQDRIKSLAAKGGG